MSEDPAQIIHRPVRFRLPGMDEVSVEPDLPFPGSDGKPLALDLYSPAGAGRSARLPAVVFVSGYPDPGMEAMLGAKLKDWGSYQSWARLVAASGMVAVTYTNRDPEGDVRALLAHLRAKADDLGIDADRLAIWACSGNVPNALSLLFESDRPRPRCTALCYGFMLDDPLGGTVDATVDGGGSTAVADAARAFHFANPAAGRSIAELSPDVPILLVRAGGDQTPGLNESIDRFLAAALRHDLPISFVNHPGAPHAFDVEQEGEASGAVIRLVLQFLRTRLTTAPSPAAR